MTFAAANAEPLYRRGVWILKVAEELPTIVGSKEGREVIEHSTYTVPLTAWSGGKYAYREASIELPHV